VMGRLGKRAVGGEGASELAMPDPASGVLT